MSPRLGMRTWAWPIAAAVVLGISSAEPALADAPSQAVSIADNRIEWPSWEQVVRVVALRDYNTRVVLLGTVLLGIVGGVVGTFTLLRRRALVGDVVSHSALPGIAIAFLAAERLMPDHAKSLYVLLGGALVAGLLGMIAVLAIRRTTRLKDDAALAIVLGVFFGLGIALFTVVQNVPSGNVAGLQGFIFGKAASLVADDVKLISLAALVVLVVCSLLFKELSLLCFDEDFAAAQGWPVGPLDLALMGLVAGVTVIGLQSVGLLLVVGMLIIPAAAARFWTDRVSRMTLAAGLIGGLSAAMGVVLSALFPRLATGAVIVLAGCAMFLVSLLAGVRRGVIRRLWIERKLRSHVDRDHLLRALYESLEPTMKANELAAADAFLGRGVSFEQLEARRSWRPRRLERLLAAAVAEGLIERRGDGMYRLTERGLRGARRAARNHRLWELYLISHADIAPNRVDRYADLIEHVVEGEVMAELEALLAEEYPHLSALPPSPHKLERVEAASTAN